MIRRRALVTGAAGQDGSFLTELLLAKDYEVLCLVREGSTAANAVTALDHPQLRVVAGDLCDRPSLVQAVEQANPDEVYNLAAMSAVDSSWQTAESTSDVNAMGVVRLLEVLREVRSLSAVQFYQASTSEIFGRATDSPQSESTQLRPRSPYGVAKAFAHQMVEDYRNRHGLFGCCGILYNHESERRPTSFVVRKVTNAAARISLGLQSSVELGNLEAQRDWGFAGDYVEAMWRMLQAPAPADYVVATGTPRSVADLLDVAFACVGIEDWSPHVVVNQAFVRPTEAVTLTGDSTKARTELDWAPSMTFDQMISRMVRFDLELESGLVEADRASQRR